MKKTKYLIYSTAFGELIYKISGRIRGDGTTKAQYVGRQHLFYCEIRKGRPTYYNICGFNSMLTIEDGKSKIREI